MQRGKLFTMLASGHLKSSHRLPWYSCETAWRMKISWRGSFVLSSTGVKLTLVGSPFNTHSDSLMESDWPLWSEHDVRRSGNTAAYLAGVPKDSCRLGLRMPTIYWESTVLITVTIDTLFAYIITISVKLLCKGYWNRTLYVYMLLIKVNLRSILM
jgi:hypothetical protein